MQGQELSALYASCDAFVFPSSTETFGNVVLEAMASGLPVITVNSGGVIDNVFDGQNGLLCEARDAVSLAAGITKLADDSRLREILASNAQAHAATKSWSSIFDQLVRDYDFVLEKNRANLQVSLAG
jgi:glycosyltransferase involved in cell wall biosynthesis